MTKGMKKMLSKMEQREKNNPGHKEKYDRPLRPRSVVFKTGKEYNRADNRKAIQEASEGFYEALEEGNNMSGFLSKQEQLDLILKVNPADDENMSEHTWIRTIDDVLTFEEAVQAAWKENDWKPFSFTPDFDSISMETALRTQEISVYSSKPIINGNFVSPSLMEAASYSGTGMVYRADLDIRDIAWIDIGQGQVATNNPITYQEVYIRGII